LPPETIRTPSGLIATEYEPPLVSVHRLQPPEPWNLPQADLAVGPRGRQALAVAGERQGEDAALVGVEEPDFLARI